VFGRRRDDPVLPTGTPEGAAPLDLAAEWLREILQDEFGEASGEERFPRTPATAARPGGDEFDRNSFLVWRREWLSRWRRLQLVEQLQSYRDALERADSAETVHAAFAEHAAAIIGAYVCLVFVRPDGEYFAPLPLPGAPVPERLRIGPLGHGAAEVVLPSDLSVDSPLAGVAPLFEETSASSLLMARYGRGYAVLVERRSHREFETLDGEIFDLLAAEAATALHRVTLVKRLGGGVAPDRPERERGEEVLRHARAGIALGMEMTLVRVRLDLERRDVAAGEDLMRHCAAVLRREVRGAGPVLRTGDAELLLVLNGGVRAAGDMLDRARARFGEGARLEITLEDAPPVLGPPSSS
jgi:hypothetical protein